MQKEVISTEQAIKLIILFSVGSTSIFVPGLSAGKDSWLAVIVAFVMVLPMIMIFARIHANFPSKDLFEIIEICFGKFISKIILLIIIWYTFFWVSDVLINYGQYIQVTSLPKTPRVINMAILAVLCCWVLKQGIESLARWSYIFVYIPFVILVGISLLSITIMDVSNILPIFNNGYKPVLKGAFSVFSQPLTQIFVFTMVFSDFRKSNSSYRIYLTSLLIAGIYILIFTLINLLVLGEDAANSMSYPAYNMVRRIDVAQIFQRIEILESLSFILGGFVKISILLLCLSKGVTKLFNFKDYRFLLFPIMLLVLNLASFLYEDVISYKDFNNEIWPYYFLPFQVILPIIILGVSEIKKKKFK
ncbi:spore germination protein KB [Desulfonispora thiosulfatigenes DSM 11270]|uniref:Spore germination protein KB n=1 Tax=Desulfonispora thiosulfatigenes DSM 11270 TaxID=656914 RepID=A0A1W1UXZ2_DESTI|nr:endospore germination permease [Desulfonispora thiosulfatigenes]SMB85624.1 spore germination protein KB [Desulfonispora thiosulfatigenes DSM 11270]